MEPILQQLLDAGQSVWLDNLSRELLATGDLRRMIVQGVRGVTSNPTIFGKAIAHANDYDDEIRALGATDAESVFWNLAIQDIQDALDLFRPLYDSTDGADGFVSLEVSPMLAHDTRATVAMAQHLWTRAGRPNVMIKIPATLEGMPAIEECTAAGININVTLVFSPDMYEQAAKAYIRGLKRRLDGGEPIATIASVNSLFISRIDTAVDDCWIGNLRAINRFRIYAAGPGTPTSSLHINVTVTFFMVSNSRRLLRKERGLNVRSGRARGRKTRRFRL